jgi:hypothetical protein
LTDFEADEHWTQVTSPRLLWAIGLLAWTAVLACQDRKTTTSLICQSFASAQELCDGQGCDPTWTAVETNHAYCNSCAVGTYLAGDCGDYSVLNYLAVDSGSSAYYRRDTGALVATEVWGAPNLTAICSVVAGEVFSPPASCDTAQFFMLPGWCSPDAGAGGARVFPCCMGSVSSPNVTSFYPATWPQAQAQAASLCGAQSSDAQPELGSCGGDQMFRYRTGNVPFTLYYDASGALIAVVDESAGRCDWGVVGGLTLPACDATLASACADGGASP